MIIISPYAKAMRNGKPHPKDYPWWPELIQLIQASTQHSIVQIGINGEKQLVPDFRRNLSIPQLETLVHECTTWISVDSFFQHLCWYHGKRGIVLFGQSDPNIFGHEENINLLAGRQHLRQHQFWLWEQAEFKAEAFVKPDEVLYALQSITST
jgi:ADP-heptose:LPS heptosyltransferase